MNRRIHLIGAFLCLAIMASAQKPMELELQVEKKANELNELLDLRNDQMPAVKAAVGGTTQVIVDDYKENYEMVMRMVNTLEEEKQGMKIILSKEQFKKYQQYHDQRIKVLWDVFGLSNDMDESNRKPSSTLR